MIAQAPVLNFKVCFLITPVVLPEVAFLLSIDRSRRCSCRNMDWRIKGRVTTWSTPGNKEHIAYIYIDRGTLLQTDANYIIGWERPLVFHPEL